MSGQDPIMYDYQTLQTAFQTVKQFGQQVNKLGTALTNVHNELEEHCSGDESGVGAVIAGAAKDVTGVAGKVFTEGGRVLAEMGTRGKTNGERTQNTDQTIADTLNKINDGLNGGGTSGSSNGEGDRGITQTGGGTGTGTGSQTGTGATTGVGEDGGSGGQSAEGNDECTQDGEPVDVVSGQLLTSAADVQLPGTLALVLRRAYASGYQGGRLFGPGWSSTLDQRVEVDDDGIHFYGDDAQILHYAVPTLPGQRVLPAAGEHWLLTWDRASDTIRVHDPRSGWTREFAGGAARKADRHDTRPIKAITDRHGNRIEFHHDRDGLPSEVRHTGGYRVAVDTVHTADGFRIEALRLLGRDSAMPGTKLIDYGYDPYGRLTALTDSSDVPFIYEYDAADRISAWIDRNGYRYEYSYDQTGRVLTGHGEDGYLSATFAYDLEKRVTTVTDSTGRKTRYHYDAHRHVVAIEDPLGRHSTNTLDQHGRLLARTDALGGTTRFELTESGDPRRIERPDGTVVTIDYDERGNPTRVVRPDASVWQYTYDATGNLLTVTDPLGATFSRTYDDRGTLTSVADPFGRSYQYETDAAGLVTGVIDPAGVHVASITRDAFGRVATHADAMGGLTRNGWTTEGLPTWREYPDGSRETWEHDPEGNLASHVAPSGAVTHYTAGPFGIVLTRRGGDSGLLAFEYDTELRLTAVVNALGQRWSYEFDAVGNVSAETDFCGRTVRYRSDATGRLVHRVNGAGQAVWFERDLMGRVVRRVSEDSSVEFGYDSVGRITRAIADDWVLDYVRDPMGRVVAESSDGRHTAYTYDKAGRLTSRTTPSGITSTWTYDAAGHASGLRALEHSITFDYDVAGRETTRHLGDHAALTQSWDAAHRLTGQSLWKFNGAHEAPGEAGYTALQQRTYAYRAGGQLTAVHDLLRGSRTYELDAAGRVTTVNAAAWTERYVYDEVGNLSSADRPHSGGSPEVTGAPGGRWEYQGSRATRAGHVHYDYDGQGRITRILRRTLSGQRREWRLGWNAEDRLTTVHGPDGRWLYRYDALGRRTAKMRQLEDGTSAVEHTYFSWDGTRLAEQSVTTGSDDGPITQTWDYEPGGYTPIAQYETTFDPSRQEIDRRFYAIITDLVGTPQELVNADGEIAWLVTTDLWGAVVSRSEAQIDCPLRSPGQYHDAETDWYYNYFRYYAPESGRYATADPLGLAPAPDPYAYVDNPLTSFDPLGLARKCANGQKATDLRKAPGVATGGEDLPEVDGKWLRGSKGNGGRIPGQIADQLRGQNFTSFDDFRQSFWTAVGNDPDLAGQFTPSNQSNMKGGNAPSTAEDQQYQGQKRYVLHHVTPIWAGGGVYDMDNLVIVTPRYHAEILDPTYHYNR